VSIVDRIPFADVAEAHRRLESRQVAGKLLLSFMGS
jgi:NADPH:quinone reductase-like Zn-dependent oxidoreductase